MRSKQISKVLVHQTGPQRFAVVSINGETIRDGFRSRAERNDIAGYETGMDARPVEQRVQHITEHGCGSCLECVPHVLRICEGIGDEEPRWLGC